MERDSIRRLLVTLGLAAVFIPIGVWEIVNPQFWVGFVPTFLTGIATPLVLVHGAVLTIIGIWALTQWKLRWAGVFATLIMLEITTSLLFESGFSSIWIRDVGILFLAASLMFEKGKLL